MIIRRLLVGLILVATIGSSAIGVLVWHGREVSAERFHWGALIRPYALETVASHATYDWRAAVTSQLELAHELGLTTIRVDLEHDSIMMRQFLTLIKQAGFETVLVVDRPDKDFASPTTDFAHLGRELGDRVARDYAGLVDVWQLANEVSGSAVHQGDDSGPTLPNRYGLSYDKTRYSNVRDYTRAMGEAIRARDPRARLMLTGHWVLVDIIPMLQKDGVPFEIVGWDWYSDQGVDPAAKLVDGQPPLDLPTLFTDLDKEFWLAEVNRESGSFGGHERDQASWLAEVGRAVNRNPKVSGLTFFMLGDKADEVAAQQTTGSLGLVPVTFDARGFARFAMPKPAFANYQTSIAARPFLDPTRSSTAFDRFSLQTYRSFTALAHE